MMECITNPLFLFLAVWGVAVAMYLAGIRTGMFAAPEPALWAAVLLSVGGFSLGYLTWTGFRRLLPPARPALSHTSVLTPERIRRGLWITGLMGLVALGLALYRIAVIASSFSTTFHDLLRDPDLLRVGFVGFIATGIFQTNWMVMLSSVASGLFSIGFVLLGILLHVDAGRGKYVYLFGFLLISLLISLTSVSRYEFTVNVLYLVFAYGFIRFSDAPPRTGRRLVQILLPLIAVAVLFLVIDALLHKSALFGQPSRLRGFAFHFYWYIASPLAAFNELLTTFDDHHHLGQYMFFPLYKWLYKFGLVPETDISMFGDFVFIPYVANVYTWLRSFYEDFGMAGVALGPYLFGWLSAVLRPRAGTYFPYLNLYLVLLVFILFSFYNYFLFSNQIYLQILFGFLFLRYRLPEGRDAGAERWPYSRRHG